MKDQNTRVREQFLRQASAYAALVNAQPQFSLPDPLIELMSLRSSQRVLDVGCGSGQLAVAIAPRVAEVMGVDLTPAMLAEAQAHAQAAGVVNVRWQVADSVALLVKDANFDVVVSRSMFHHAADPSAPFTERRRVGAPGGRIFVSDLAPDPPKSPAADAIELLRDPSHRRALTLEELRRMGRDLDLTEIAVHSGAASLPLEAVLATSFPAAGMLDHVRALMARDVENGSDVFGMSTESRDGAIWVTYPTMIVGWQVD